GRRPRQVGSGPTLARASLLKLLKTNPKLGISFSANIGDRRGLAAAVNRIPPLANVILAQAPLTCSA
ncbi:hypothetical protein, partial [Gemmobacter nectariphilus]|uniref:hypothetical protein n=1 Tax=Gemmobacter nectariphilus TaxID=220343 RepID=UPI001B7F88D8